MSGRLCIFSKDACIKLERVTKIQPDSMQCSFSRLYGGLEYPASKVFFLVSLLACTKSFASVARVLGAEYAKY